MTKGKKDKLSVYILLDRTGSMQVRWVEALSSVNAYVEKLAKDKAKAAVTLALFDRHANGPQFDVIRDKQSPADWKPVSDADATPRGDTPLYDAVGKLVNLAEQENSEKAVLVVMTDGQENSSREMTRESAKAALERCKRRGWQVVFLGADFDAVTQASTVGVMRANSLNMSVGNYAATMDSLGEKTVAYAASGSGISFSEADRQLATGNKKL